MLLTDHLSGVSCTHTPKVTHPHICMHTSRGGQMSAHFTHFVFAGFIYVYISLCVVCLRISLFTFYYMWTYFYSQQQLHVFIQRNKVKCPYLLLLRMYVTMCNDIFFNDQLSLCRLLVYFLFLFLLFFISHYLQLTPFLLLLSGLFFHF